VIAPVSLDPASVPAAAAADASQSEDTPVVLEEIAGERDLTGSTDWQPADFSKQEQALGWSAEAFKVPLGLERNYQFWLDIYTKYTTDQGVLHDAEAIDCIYEVLDFSHISSRSDLSSFQKAKQKKLAVQNAKKDISEKLKALQKIFEKNPAEEPKDLPPDELKMYQCFKDFPGKKRFADATSRNRLRFQLGQRDRMVQGIFFSGRYLRDFEKDFRDAGLPIELTRLPFVESSYNVLARSKVGASGLWQIMKATSKPYMHRDPAIDMRNYPLAAAHLATKIFKMNYELLESWPLAVTGYNHGPAGVKRLTQLYKTRDLSELARSHSSRKKLGFASRNFYVSFLAALEAERNAPKYFGPILWSKSLDCQEITLTKPVTWAEVVAWYDGNEKIAQIYNPHITALGKARGHKIPKGVLMMIPKAKPELKSKYAE
jgi:membrane-bound lytic murein transglycosylase D